MMNRAKHIYVSGTEVPTCIGYGQSLDDYSDIAAFEFTDELRIVDLEWTNRGVIFTLENDKGFRYHMSDILFKKFLYDRPNALKINAKFGFYKQGRFQSVGVVE